jgi:hypothetical protein
VPRVPLVRLALTLGSALVLKCVAERLGIGAAGGGGGGSGGAGWQEEEEAGRGRVGGAGQEDEDAGESDGRLGTPSCGTGLRGNKDSG